MHATLLPLFACTDDEDGKALATRVLALLVPVVTDFLLAIVLPPFAAVADGDDDGADAVAFAAIAAVATAETDVDVDVGGYATAII